VVATQAGSGARGMDTSPGDDGVWVYPEIPRRMTPETTTMLHP
jgi:hypothetical protein